ncbi:FAD-binding oxidoreductase [Rhizobium sp. KVB221]|uniref:FAD-binding oxidoreductase n=1 Tax=Rhizobium setariae TaxID=2801340 RepID=A0A936YTR1_9HYPH|nr:FAD-binding oxidoreductase [Rhizobium setariae]MBL0372886.1 FAD-binding oxidoreductase [Rhizobium setariae]
MGKLRRRSLLIGGSALFGAATGRWLLQPSSSSGPAYPEYDSYSAANGNILNDASLLEPTQIHKHVTINSGIDSTFIHRVRALVIEARETRKPLIAGTTRHSMGGQSIPENGIALTLLQDQLVADPATKTYKVAAGVRWRTVVAELDKIGFSPAVMQSNNDFGVASTFSVNAHGWPVPFSGCGSTVRSIKLMIGDGTIQKCSRTENPELFRHAMGGYGLVGIITELELDMVPNTRLEPKFEHVRGEDLGTHFVEAMKSDPKIEMAYGRLDVSLDRFFQDGLLISYRPTEDQQDIPAASGSGLLTQLSRYVFRAQLGSDDAKHFRWWTESALSPMFVGEATRNSLLNEPVIALDDADPSRTDILHEYFVAPQRFGDFIKACREVIPASYQQLLNVTIRYVAEDKDSVLAYAPEPRIASVMLFSQEMSARGEADMRRMTHALIERVIALGGSYYLPYRPHASLDQLTRAYPRAAEFAQFKRQVDKDLIFRHRMWDRYFSKL